MSYRDRREQYIAKMDGGYKASIIWEKFKKDFGHGKSTVRGYGLSSVKEGRRVSFQRCAKFVTHLFSIVEIFLKKFKAVIFRVLSFLFFGDQIAAKKYSYDKYLDNVYDSELINEFLKEYSSKGIGLTHHTLKTYYYLKTLKSVIGNDFFSSPKNILEIGAGMFNFGHLVSQESNGFNYVICDLPEMIVSAHSEITDHYLTKTSGQYEVFLPSEIDNFKRSKANKKVLFIEASSKEQILDLDLDFDLFINHESFAEMNIEIVNKYLSLVGNCLKKNGILNIINRYSRLQTIDKMDGAETLNNITSFHEYNLEGFQVIYKELDQFRNTIPTQREDPNVFYIGRVKN